MSDLENWQVHGPVHTLRIELAEWDLSREKWQEPRSFSFVRFLPGGAIGESETHNPDGPVSRRSHSYDAAGLLRYVEFQVGGGPVTRTVYSYDGSGRLSHVSAVDPDGNERELESYSYSPEGRLTKLYFVPKLEPGVSFMYSIEGTPRSYGAPGAATVATVYDERGHAGEVLFYDAGHRLLRSLILQRDAAGRLVREELHLHEQIPFPEMQSQSANMPPKVRQAVAATLSNLFGTYHFATYVYHPSGLVSQLSERIGEISERRTTYRYDEAGNEAEQTIENTSREMRIDGEGLIQVAHERFEKQHVRFDYRYDAQRNWTERTVWTRLEPNPDLHPSNIERREITYYPV